MTEEEAKKLLSGELWKSAEDGEAAGRLTAHGYAGEMRRLCQAFGLDKAAEGAAAEEKTEGGEKTETSSAAVSTSTEVALKADAEADPLDALVQELGGIA